MKAREAPTPQEMAAAALEILQAKINSLRDTIKNPKAGADLTLVLEDVDGATNFIRLALREAQDNGAKALEGLIR